MLPMPLASTMIRRTGSARHGSFDLCNRPRNRKDDSEPSMELVLETMLTSRFGSPATLPGTRPDQLALGFGQARVDGIRRS